MALRLQWGESGELAVPHTTAAHITTLTRLLLRTVVTHSCLLTSNQMQIADFNRDGRPDIYFGMEMLLASGGGAYTAIDTPSLYPGAGWTKDIAWGDVNGDGLLDLIITRAVRYSALEMKLHLHLKLTDLSPSISVTS